MDASKSWLAVYFTSFAIQSCLFIASIVALVLSVIKTYDGEGFSLSGTSGAVYRVMNGLVLLIFFLDYCVNVYASAHKLRFLFSWIGLNNAFSLLSVSLNLASDPNLFFIILHLNRVSFGRLALLAIFGRRDSKGVSREITTGLVGLVNFLLISSSLVLIVERKLPGSFNSVFHSTAFEWHTALYFVIVTVTTVGFGDVSPSSDVAQIMVILMILIGLSLIPIFATSLTKVLLSKPKYKGRFILATARQHVCMCGIVTHGMLKVFTDELTRDGRMIIVVLSPQQPSSRVEALLHNPFYSKHIFFFVGSNKEDRDMSRVLLHLASAVYISNDLEAGSQREVEDSTVLSAIAVDSYLHRRCSTVGLKRPRVLVSLPSSAARGLPLMRDMCDAVVAQQEFKYSLLGAGLAVPGLLGLFYTLNCTYRINSRSFGRNVPKSEIGHGDGSDEGDDDDESDGKCRSTYADNGQDNLYFTTTMGQRGKNDTRARHDDQVRLYQISLEGTLDPASTRLSFHAAVGAIYRGTAGLSLPVAMRLSRNNNVVANPGPFCLLGEAKSLLLLTRGECPTLFHLHSLLAFHTASRTAPASRPSWEHGDDVKQSLSTHSSSSNGVGTHSPLPSKHTSRELDENDCGVTVEYPPMQVDPLHETHFSGWPVLHILNPGASENLIGFNQASTLSTLRHTSRTGRSSIETRRGIPSSLPSAALSRQYDHIVLILTSLPHKLSDHISLRTSGTAANILMMPVIHCLRAIRRSTDLPVVILSEGANDMHELSRDIPRINRCLLQDVSFFQGSPRNAEHLLLCGATAARSVLVLAPPRLSASSDTASDPSVLMPDVTTVIVYHTLSMLLRTSTTTTEKKVPFVITELIDGANRQLLPSHVLARGILPTGQPPEPDTGTSEQFLAGTLYGPKLMDACVAQSILAPDVLDFWEALLSCSGRGAKGSSFQRAMAMHDRHRHQEEHRNSFHREEEEELLYDMKSFDGDEGQQSQIVRRSGGSFVGRTYGSIVLQELGQTNDLVIAIAHASNLISVNPDMDTILCAGDDIMLISSRRVAE